MIEFFIRRPVFVAMVLIGLCLLGVISYLQLPMELFPETESPRMIVTVRGGTTSDPAYVEQHAVIPVESAIAGLDKIDRIETQIDQRRGTIYVYYGNDVNLKYAFLKLQQCVATVRAAIGTEFTFTVSKSDTEQLSNRYLTLQARGEGNVDQIRAVVDEKITPELLSIDGVASVEVYGGRKRSVEVLLDDNAMKSFGLTIGQVQSKISEQSGKRQYLGQALDPRKEYFVNLVAEYTSIPAIGDLIVKDKGPIVLKQIAKISEGGAEQTAISRINGQEAVTLSLQRSWEANLISLAGRTRQAMARLNETVKPDGISLVIQTDEAQTIQGNLSSIFWLIVAGGLLAIAVLWMFLRNMGLVVTVSASVPISILISMNVFYALHITINTLTMVGLAIAIGMLVDCSVVVLENIVRHYDRTGDAHRSVVTGTKEVGRAVFASTLTTIGVFLPFLFSTNTEIRTLGAQAGASIITTLLISLAVAFFLIPVLANWFFSRRQRKSPGAEHAVRSMGRMRQIYVVLLKTSLRNPARTLVATVALFFLTLGLCLMQSVNAPREVQLSTFNIYAIMPSGTTLEAADDQVKAMDGLVKDVPEVSDRLATIEEDNVTITFRLAEDYAKTSTRSVTEIKDDIIDRLSRGYPRVEFSTTEPTQNSRYMGSGGGGGGGGTGGAGSRQTGVSLTRMLGIGTAQEKVLVRGQDLGLLRAVAEDVRYNVSNLDTVQSATLNVSNQSPSIDLQLDQASMSHFDVSLQAVRNELSGFQKETTTDIKFTTANEEIDIVLKSADDKDKTTGDLRQLQFPTTSGGLVPLPLISRLVYSSGYSNINRINQEEQVQVTYRFNTDIEQSKALLEAARSSVEDLVASIAPPPGVIIEVVRDESDMSEFYYMLALGILLLYMILASTFEGFRTPLVMLFTLPLAGIGAFSALILTSNSLYNANVLIGFLLLFGVVVNNGVLLIDYARRLELRHQRRTRALMTAGLTRVRPILITAITTVLGMLPVALGKQEYISMIGTPFAVTVMGGLAVATLFTLVLIPTFSHGLENALAWWRGLGWKSKLVQGLAFGAGIWFLMANIDSLLWRIAYALILFVGIPAFTFFAQTSLRRSRSKLVPPGAAVTITIRNISKLYDDFAKFTKEWRKGRREKEHRTVSEAELRRERFQSFLWAVPVYAFLIYFTYFYLQGNAWHLIFAALTYGLLAGLLEGWRKRRRGRPASVRTKIGGIAAAALFWGIPLADGLWLQSRWQRWGAVGVVLVLWYGILAVYRTSRMIEERKINVNRVTGRLRKPRTAFYRFVLKIPIIGASRSPFQALDRVSLEIGSGMFGLVGPNGSGKTTLMRIICGILPPSRGKIYFNELDLGLYREELQALIGYLPQEFGAYESLTAVQFLDYQAQLKGLWDTEARKTAVESSLRAVHLADRGHDKIKTYSGGMKQRLGIAQTLLHLPRILVVDEPTAGLDPTERIAFRNMLSELARDRIVIFSTHIIEDISSSCNRLAVLLKGKVRFVGTPAELVNLTRGSVWQVTVDDLDFDTIRRTHKVVHHLRDGLRIRARILSALRPTDDAQPVVPTLEDSYMWLLGQEGMTR
jgi:multidrug efflux pump subunit AcrB/ABC-type multidrug transport system ATPase subunit